ncbi:MAG TPA: cytochrome c oxidase accessory protein CcoG, partial [Gammaproteobacteria bacterium]|nr:cytochrome c oxidase accessory protein CcoG [Gammaproteobacteria bacterium]
AACIDACDSVMDRVGYPRGLIRYSTEHALHHEGYRLLRPRTIVYSTILVVLVTALVSAIALRPPVILDVIRDRNTLYRDVGRQGIENSYTVRIVNKHNRDHRYRLSVSGMPGIRLETPDEIAIAGESVQTMPVSVTAPHEVAVGGNVVEFRLESLTDPGVAVTEESRFRGPQEGR